MRKIEKELFYFVGLLVAVRLGNAASFSQKTVTDLMLSDTDDKLGLVKYYKELELDKFCMLPVLDDESFKTFEKKDFVPCLCTVIYRMNKEFASRNINTLNVELVKRKIKDFKLNNTTYEVWKNVAKMSPSLKLLMDPLVNMTQWNAICYNYVSKDIGPFCKFLNVEVSLLYNFIQTPNESIKENSVKTPEKYIKQEISNVKPKEKKILENLPETNVIGPVNANEEPDTEDDQKLKVEDNNDDEHTDSIFNKEDPMNNDEIDQEKPVNVEGVKISNESKTNLQSNNDYPKEDDGTIIHKENKENELLLISKKTFPNNQFGDTEESHFLFYFGRRSTNHRRRPNTASYSKVETDDGSTVF